MASDPSSTESSTWWQRPKYALPFAFLWPLATIGGMIASTNISISTCKHWVGDYNSALLFNLLLAALAYVPGILAIFFMKGGETKKKFLWFAYFVFAPVTYVASVFALLTFGIACIT